MCRPLHLHKFQFLYQRLFFARSHNNPIKKELLECVALVMPVFNTGLNLSHTQKKTKFKISNCHAFIKIQHSISPFSFVLIISLCVFFFSRARKNAQRCVFFFARVFGSDSTRRSTFRFLLFFHSKLRLHNFN